MINGQEASGINLSNFRTWPNLRPSYYLVTAVFCKLIVWLWKLIVCVYSVTICPGYLYSDARDQYHFVWRDTNEEPHPSECLDCLSEVIEASRLPPTEQFVISGPDCILKQKIKGIKSKARWWMKGKTGHAAPILLHFWHRLSKFYS